MRRVLVLAALGSLSLPAQAQALSSWRAVATETGIHPSLYGTWKSLGYGWVFDIGPDGAAGYDISEAGCLRGETQTAETLARWARVFALDSDRLRISSSPTNSTQYVFEPIPAVPEACATPPDASPRGVFDYAWGVMKEHYAFFDLHGVDWDARYAALSPRIREDMTEAELFDVFETLLEGLNDQHLGLTAEIEGESRRFQGWRSTILGPAITEAFEAQDEIPTRGAFANQWFVETRRQIEEEVLMGTATASESDNMFWGRRGRVGYLFLRGMDGFTAREDAPFEDQVPAADSVMTQALTDLADTDALVIDLVLNRGGYDDVSISIASRFANQPAPGPTMYAFGAEADTRQSFIVEPASGIRYLKPVTLLTSELTVSAAETFTLQMRALPNVTHVGEPTTGSLSGALVRPLPNGWVLELSNEVFLDTNGELWEGRGIPPHVPMPVFRLDDLGSYIATLTGLMDWLLTTLGNSPARGHPGLER
ncbi:MAG: S41 family peptidase [Rubricoccaceae bacterium]